MTTEYKLIDVEIDNGVAIVALDRPDRRNALDLEMVDEISSAFDEVEQAEEIFAAVVTGRGLAFCAGADLGMLAGGSNEDFLRIYEGFLRVGRSTLPTVAAVNGAAVGAGLNLALCCDVRVVSPSARFVSRFPTLGLHPGGGHGWMIQQTAGAELAAAMLLFGHELRGADIVDAGLALTYVPLEEELLPAAVSFARGAVGVPKPLLARLKQTLVTHRTIGDQTEAVKVEFDAQAWSREQGFSAERIAEFRNRTRESAG